MVLRLGHTVARMTAVDRKEPDLPRDFCVAGASWRHQDGKKPLNSALPTSSNASLMPISPTSARDKSVNETAIRITRKFHRSSSCSNTTCVGDGAWPSAMYRLRSFTMSSGCR